MKAKYFTILISLVLIGFYSCKDNAKNTHQIELNEENSILIKDQFGEYRIPKNPKRVVVFDLGALDIMDELGLGDRVIGMPKQTVPGYLDSYKNDENIVPTGSLVEPYFEKVNEANPDLIIMGIRQEKDREELSKIAPTLFFSVDYDHYVNSISDNIQLIGELFEMQPEAKAINEDMLTSIRASKITDDSLKGLFVMFNNDKFSAYGQGSRFGYIHDEFNVPPLSEDLKPSTHGQSISSEFIQEHDPDILFVLDRNAAIGDGEINKKSIENKLIQQTKAYENGKVIYLSPQVWYLAGGGVQSMKIMAKEVREAL